MSNFTNYDDLKSDSQQSQLNRNSKPVADANLRKLLADPKINENERMKAVKLRTEQIEQRAKMEEQKLKSKFPGEQTSSCLVSQLSQGLKNKI